MYTYVNRSYVLEPVYMCTALHTYRFVYFHCGQLRQMADLNAMFVIFQAAHHLRISTGSLHSRMRPESGRIT